MRRVLSALRGATCYCSRYQLVGEPYWLAIPEGVKVPHPFRPGATQASAFVVERIERPAELFRLTGKAHGSRDLYRREANTCSGPQSRLIAMVRMVSTS
jgi:hypothetical protein